MKTYLYIWFDVEDYVTAESDVALGRLIEIMNRHEVKATYKMVGEKVRGLQRRGHADIVKQLAEQDIGYHTDFHSKPPSIAAYMLECDWDGGVAEFIRRERTGLTTLEQVFGHAPSCYGQPGGSWAPQVYPALRQWGIPVYLDAGPWVNLSGKPHRYCDILNLLSLEHTMHIGISGGAERVRERARQLTDTVEKLRHTGGEISLYAHECEFVTAQFWDAVNFRSGSDSARQEWQPAPLLEEEERESRYAAMDEFLALVGRLPEVEIIVASQMPQIYPDHAKGRSFTPQQISRMGQAMADRISHCWCDDVVLSPAEVFSLVVRLLAARIQRGTWPSAVTYQYVDGPVQEPHVAPGGKLALEDVFGTCLYEGAALGMNGRMPSEVQIGKAWLSPADFLATVGAALPRWVDGNDGDAPVIHGRLDQAQYVPEHVSWNWTIFPPEFDGDPLLQLGRLQSWTIKPAKGID